MGAQQGTECVSCTSLHVAFNSNEMVFGDGASGLDEVTREKATELAV